MAVFSDSSAGKSQFRWLVAPDDRGRDCPGAWNICRSRPLTAPVRRGAVAAAFLFGSTSIRMIQRGAHRLLRLLPPQAFQRFLPPPHPCLADFLLRPCATSSLWILDPLDSPRRPLASAFSTMHQVSPGDSVIGPLLHVGHCPVRLMYARAHRNWKRGSHSLREPL
jgi:hypothetical protein